MRRSHRDRHAAGVKAAVKRHDEVDTWWRKVREGREGVKVEEETQGGEVIKTEEMEAGGQIG